MANLTLAGLVIINRGDAIATSHKVCMALARGYLATTVAPAIVQDNPIILPAQAARVVVAAISI